MENQVKLAVPALDSDMANFFGLCTVAFLLLPPKEKLLVVATVTLTLGFKEYFRKLQIQ